MTMIAAVLDAELELSEQAVWCVRLASTKGASLVVFRLPSSPTEEVLKRTALRDVAGLEFVSVADRAGLFAALNERSFGALILFRREHPDSHALRAHVLARVSCEVLVVRIGDKLGAAPLRVLVPMARGPHARLALRLAQKLAGDAGEVTALYVEPPVELDAEQVGQRVLDRMVRSALGDSPAVGRRVEIAADIVRGIVQAIEPSANSVVLTGASKTSALGQRLLGTVSAKLAKAAPHTNVVLVRAAVPLTGRVRAFVENWILRPVPQLERDQRVALVERVQSNSYWNFDFIALMSLATSIAAIGLVQASEAVVIGAMLVAPLMTPIVGCGLALVHGNPVLARNALRSVILGFVTAFCIGFGLGIAHPAFDAPTISMLGRDWPDLLDLIVAFVAGFAGAYATSRPNLSAALPGVAIAAALVPPIATSGLSLALGEVWLSLGAAMLFFTNMVAIILASNLCLWAVGMREVKPKSVAFVLSGNALVGIVLAMGVWFSIGSPRVNDPLRAAIEQCVGDSHNVRSVAIESVRVPIRLFVRVAGAAPPRAGLAAALESIAEAKLGLDDVRVNVEWRWEQSSGGD